MRRSDALQVLRLHDPFDAEQLRAAYHDAAMAVHPDRPGAPSDATDRMAAVNAAYAVLVGTAGTAPAGAGGAGTAPPDPEATVPEPQRAARRHPGREPLPVMLLDGSLLVDAPADETFDALLDAVEVIGDPTYVDAEAGLLQIIVRHADGGHGYLTFSLQGRAAGTEVFTTLERLDTQPPPSREAAALLLALADAISAP